MPTPAELRALSVQGAKNRELAEKVKRQEEERVAREKRMEKFAKDQAEAQRQIVNIDCDMKWAAEAGRTSIRLGQVYTTDLDRLEGVNWIIANHYIKAGFEVSIETVDGPEIRFEPDYLHYIRVSW